MKTASSIAKFVGYISSIVLSLTIIVFLSRFLFLAGLGFVCTVKDLLEHRRGRVYGEIVK